MPKVYLKSKDKIQPTLTYVDILKRPVSHTVNIIVYYRRVVWNRNRYLNVPHMKGIPTLQRYWSRSVYRTKVPAHHSEAFICLHMHVSSLTKPLFCWIGFWLDSTNIWSLSHSSLKQCWQLGMIFFPLTWISARLSHVCLSALKEFLLSTSLKSNSSMFEKWSGSFITLSQSSLCARSSFFFLWPLGFDTTIQMKLFFKASDRETSDTWSHHTFNKSTLYEHWEMLSFTLNIFINTNLIELYLFFK